MILKNDSKSLIQHLKIIVPYNKLMHCIMLDIEFQPNGNWKIELIFPWCQCFWIKWGLGRGQKLAWIAIWFSSQFSFVVACSSKDWKSLRLNINSDCASGLYSIVFRKILKGGQNLEWIFAEIFAEPLLLSILLCCCVLLAGLKFSNKQSLLSINLHYHHIICLYR